MILPNKSVINALRRHYERLALAYAHEDTPLDSLPDTDLISNVFASQFGTTNDQQSYNSQINSHRTI